jgi:hypothetical protein
MSKPQPAAPQAPTGAPVSPAGFLRGTIVRHGDLVSPDSERWTASKTDPLLVRGTMRAARKTSALVKEPSPDYVGRTAHSASQRSD